METLTGPSPGAAAQRSLPPRGAGARSAKREAMSQAEAERRFPNQWIVLEVKRYTRGLRVARGYLVAHAPDGDAAHAAAQRYWQEHPAAELAIFYHGEGQLPPGVEVVL